MSNDTTPTPRTDVNETPLVYAAAVKAGEVYPNARVVQLRDAQEIEVQRNTLERELAAAKAENAELRKDRERLDWLEANIASHAIDQFVDWERPIHRYCIERFGENGALALYTGEALRSVIDEAKAATEGGER